MWISDTILDCRYKKLQFPVKKSDIWDESTRRNETTSYRLSFSVLVCLFRRDLVSPPLFRLACHCMLWFAEQKEKKERTGEWERICMCRSLSAVFCRADNADYSIFLCFSAPHHLPTTSAPPSACSSWVCSDSMHTSTICPSLIKGLKVCQLRDGRLWSEKR